MAQVEALPHHPPFNMGDREANDVPSETLPEASERSCPVTVENPYGVSGIEPVPPSSQHFPSALGSQTSAERPGAPRRSSIRPAPASFRPTLRDASTLAPSMVVHSGDTGSVTPSWGATELESAPSQVKLDRPSRREPFAFAADLHQTTLPLDIPPPGGVPRDLAYRSARLPSFDLEGDDAPADSAEAVTQLHLEPPAAATGQKDESAAPSEIDCEAPTLVRSDLPSVSEPPHRKGAGSSGIRSVVPAPMVTENVKSRRWVPTAIAVAFLGLCAAAFVGTRREPLTPGNTEVAPSAVEVAPPSTAPSAAEVAAAPHVEVKAPSVVAPVAAGAPEPAASDDVKRVTVTVRQPDVKVTVRGVAVKGPPYVIEVPKGKKIPVEISKTGYAARKLIVDGKKSTEVVGLVAARK